MSGTKLRQAAIDNDLEKFKSGLATGLQADAEAVFAAVREGLQPWIDQPKENFGETIVKVKGGYELKSKKTGKNLGKYPTRAGAEKRERQVQYFKHES